MVVAPGHPSSVDPRVRVAEDETARDEAVATALIEAVRPLIEACHRLGRVGRPGLWKEIADGFAYALTDPRAGEEVTTRSSDTVMRLVAAAGAPWRRRPTITIASTVAGPFCVLQKGGCCLAFTGDYRGDPASLDERAYAERFPGPPDAPDYCTTCPRRSFPDCEARQVWWHVRERVTTAVQASAT
jgi:hypothetical protein